MEQAILITAYKNIAQIEEIINFFPLNFRFYIHFDKKSKVDFKPLLNRRNVFVSNKYSVNWGGVNHLKAILYLCNEALKHQGNSYFHLITGEDFPVKSNNYFNESIDFSKSYMDYFDMPADFWIDGGMDRVEYYNFYDYLNAKKPRQLDLIYLILSIQQKLKFKRKYKSNLPKLYGGSTYWSLNRDTLNYVVDYTNKNNSLIKRMEYTLCAEELYFQTVIMNSEFSEHVINGNRRYIDWDTGRGGYPAFLDETDYSSILSSNNLFARKFEVSKSDKLKSMLKSHLLKQA